MSRLAQIEVITSPSQIGATWLQQERLSTHMSHLPHHRANRSSWRGQHDRVFVRLTSDDGHAGVGATRGTASAVVVLEHLASLMRGRDLADHASLYQEMAAAQLTYGWSGIGAAALSAVDLALWDLRANTESVPLSSLLAPNQPARTELDCYTTVHPENVGDTEGYAGVKIAARFGPMDGPEGPKLAAADIQRVRDQVGPGPLVMVDTACSWTAPFVLEMLDELGDDTLDWLEDPLLPWDTTGYLQIRERLSQSTHRPKICLGNYAFSLQDGYQVIREGLVDVFQPDATWIGGLTAMLDLYGAASSRDITFSPHYGAMHPWTVHLMAALPEVGLAEFIRTSPEPVRDDYPDLLLPVRGRQPVPTMPGSGARLGADVLNIGTNQARPLTR